MKFQAFIPKRKILRRYLDILNCSLNLTDRELDVLDLIFEIDKSWDNTPKNVIDTKSRRYIMLNTYINKNNLSRYIKKYKEQGILTEYSPKKWRINENLIPTNFDEISVTFVLKPETNE